MSRATSLMFTSILRAGATVGVQLDLGDAIYKCWPRNTRQAADHALEAQRQDSVFGAAQGYFDLALAQGSVGGRTRPYNSGDYETQLASPSNAGVALKAICCAPRSGGAHRLGGQSKNSSDRRRATCQVLDLDATVVLRRQDAELMHSAHRDQRALDTLVSQTLTSRPKWKQSQALIFAARDAKRRGLRPLIPRWARKVFGRTPAARRFGDTLGRAAGLSGRRKLARRAGGLFDVGRKRSANRD